MELYEVKFPVKIKAYYQNHYVEFEIFKPGLWDIKLDITQIKGLK